MKTLIFFSILLCVITLPALAELTSEDLDKIRLIVKEEVKAEIDPIKQEIKVLDTRLQKVEQSVARLEGRMTGIDKRFDTLEKQISHAHNLTYALIALVVVAVGIPQIIIASRWRKDVQLEKQVQGLAAEVETLNQQRIVNP